MTNVINGKGGAFVGLDIGEFSVLYARFCYEPGTALKK